MSTTTNNNEKNKLKKCTRTVRNGFNRDQTRELKLTYGMTLSSANTELVETGLLLVAPWTTRVPRL